MSRSVVFVLLLMVVLSCTTKNPTRIESTPIRDSESPTITATIVPFTSFPTKASTAENTFSIYRDKDFCITVTYPSSWNQDGEPGAFAIFTPDADGGAYTVTNVFLGESPTLQLALDNLKRGALGNSILSVEDIIIDKELATWVTFEKQARFKFLVMMITPDCGTGKHSIFISASESDQDAFVDFVNHIKFIR